MKMQSSKYECPLIISNNADKLKLVQGGNVLSKTSGHNRVKLGAIEQRHHNRI